MASSGLAEEAIGPANILCCNLWSNLKNAFLLATERAFNEFQSLTKQTSDPQLVYKTYIFSLESKVWASDSVFWGIALSIVILNTYMLWFQCVYTVGQVLVMFLWPADQSVWALRTGQGSGKTVLWFLPGASVVFESLTIRVLSLYPSITSITCMLMGQNAWFHCVLNVNGILAVRMNERWIWSNTCTLGEHTRLLNSSMSSFGVRFV